MEKGRYGLPTVIAMIVGIVIGSGIFFKSDNILLAAGGSVPLGVAAFLLGGIGIVFGGLCLGELAARTDKPGGIIAYAEDLGGLPAAAVYGWFQVFVYLPAIITVVSYAVGLYACQLFGWGRNFGADDLFLLQMGIGMGFVLLCYVVNSLSARLGGWFQNAAALCKLLPLLVVGICGLLFGQPTSFFQAASPAPAGGAGWLTAIAPIAFSFDGWAVAASISSEVKHARRNLPLALVIAPVCILLLYILYFVGISRYLGPETIMAGGDEHVEQAAIGLLGHSGGKVLLTVVLLSVMGTINGLVLGSIRLPYALALRGLLPGSRILAREHPRLQMPLAAAGLALAVSLIWSGFHIAAVRLHLLPNSDVSEVAVGLSYALYLALYGQVFRLYRRGEVKGPLRGVIFPLLAAAGGILVLSGTAHHRIFWPYAALCILFLLAAAFYAKTRGRREGAGSTSD